MVKQIADEWWGALWLTVVMWMMVAIVLELLRPGLIVQFGMPIIWWLGLLLVLLVLPITHSDWKHGQWLVPMGVSAILISVAGISVWTGVMVVILLGILIKFTNV